MKNSLVLLILVLLLSPFIAAAADTNPVRALEYSPAQTYSGIFNTDRIYFFDPQLKTWAADRQITTIDAVRCFSARGALESLGTWTGNLDSGGRCTNPAEATPRATGNYLNFLIQSKPASKSTEEN